MQGLRYDTPATQTLAMQEVNKALLIQKLLDVFHAEHPDRPADEAPLRSKIRQAIDTSLSNTQQVDTRRVTILLSDLRGFTAVADQLHDRDHRWAWWHHR